MVEHSTADREVPGSNPGAPSILKFSLFLQFVLKLLDQDDVSSTNHILSYQLENDESFAFFVIAKGVFKK